jgi:F-type H+-transporting ATPase subunit alpha
VTEEIEKQLHELSKKVKDIFEHQIIVEEIIEEDEVLSAGVENK